MFEDEIRTDQIVAEILEAIQGTHDACSALRVLERHNSRQLPAEKLHNLLHSVLEEMVKTLVELRQSVPPEGGRGKKRPNGSGHVGK